MDCIFCTIITGVLPSCVIYQDDQLLVIKDISPQAPIHYLIIPKKHIKNFQLLTAEDTDLMVALMFRAQQLSQQISGADDFKLVINNGAQAGQTVLHFHIHFLAGQQLSEV